MKKLGIKPWASLGLMLSLLVAAPAAAQTVGVQAGVSLDPDQFYVGGHVETAKLVDRLRFRPSAEIGLGDQVTLVGLNFEFAYVFPSSQAWIKACAQDFRPPEPPVCTCMRDVLAADGANPLPNALLPTDWRVTAWSRLNGNRHLSPDGRS